AVAQTGQESHGAASIGRKLSKLPEHQDSDVVRVSLRPDPPHVPLPGARERVERQETLVREGLEELDGEEGIAAGLLVHQRRELRHLRGIAVQRVREDRRHFDQRQRWNADLDDGSARLADRFEAERSGMSWRRLVVTIRRNEQEMA